MDKNAQEQIQAIINNEIAKAYNQGLLRGIEAAKTISERWYANHQLIEPHSPNDLHRYDKKTINSTYTYLRETYD